MQRICRGFLPSILGTAILAATFGNGLPVAAYIFFAAAGLLFPLFGGRAEKREKTVMGILGMLLVLFLLLPACIEKKGTLWGLSGILCVLCAGLSAPAAGSGLLFLKKAVCKKGRPLKLSPKTAFFTALAVLLACWLPVLLAFFPGITGYDMGDQISQIMSGVYSDHHPLLHTLLVKGCLDISAVCGGDFTVGYALYTVLQYTACAVCCAYALTWLCERKLGAGKWGLLLAALALLPQHGVMAVSGTKDILSSALLLVSCVEMLRLLTENERAEKTTVLAADCVLLVLSCMLRKNMVYAVAAAGMLGLLIYRKRFGLRPAVLLLGAAVVAFSGMTALRQGMNAQKGSIREVLCVPIQQLSRVCCAEDTPDELKDEIFSYLPYAGEYAPDRADAAKSAAMVDGRNTAGFLKLWGRHFFSYPGEYIDAFLENIRDYIDPTDQGYAVTYEGEPRAGAMVLWIDDTCPVEARSILPGLRDAYRKLFCENRYQNCAVLPLLIHPAMSVWLLLFAAACALAEKNHTLLYVCVLCGMYLGTLLLGPCVLIRYAWSLMLASPLLTACLGTDLCRISKR